MGATAGRSVAGVVNAISNFFFVDFALLPAFSRTPPSIHCRIVSIIASGILGDSGGIAGSEACVISSYK